MKTSKPVLTEVGSAPVPVSPNHAGTEAAPENALENAPGADTAPAKRPRLIRRRTLMLLMPCLLLASGGYMWLYGGRYMETENANLHQTRIAISTKVAGEIVASRIAENMTVRKGDVLFKLDPEPFQIALDEADAAVESSRLQVRQLRAAYIEAQKLLATAEEDARYAKTVLDRRRQLTKRGITTQATFDEAFHNARRAVKQIAVARQAVASARTALSGMIEGSLDKHPLVLSAFARKAKAEYNLKSATVRAPADGTISQSTSFTPGQYVTIGTPLFAIVEGSATWLDANFKEPDIANMKPGQSATVEFDVYPGRKLTAKITSIGAGTGAEFSILPAQNATGNWVKVTQRVPVRLKLDAIPDNIALRSGMSATVTVDTKVERHLSALLPDALLRAAPHKPWL